MEGREIDYSPTGGTKNIGVNKSCNSYMEAPWIHKIHSKYHDPAG